MKILLVNPPRFYELIGKNPAIIEDHRGYNPPLGILSLAGYLLKKTSHEVEVLDTQPYEYGYAELQEVFRKKMGDVVGITAMTFTLVDVVKTIRLIKSINPEAIVVLGGPHIHIFPDETINLPGVDFLVQGEGERTFISLLDHINDLDTLETIPGLVFKRNGKVINTGISPKIQDLDELGFPARHLVDINNYTSLLGRGNVITTMFTSRGCPFRCTFCDRPFSPVISGFRWRSAQHVVDEMEECINLGIREAFIYDDTFTVRKDRVFALCEEIKRRNIDFRWDVRAHVNTVTPEMLRAMKEAGCDRIHYGVEAGNDRMLKVIRKQTTVEHVKKVVQWTKDVDMEVLAYFMMGQQTETVADIEDSIRLARELDPNYVHFTIFCPYPATAAYFQGVQEGIIERDVWKEFATNPNENFVLPYWNENLTADQLRHLLVYAYKSFYTRPDYIIKNIARIRSPGEFKRKVKAGLSVLTMSSDQQKMTTTAIKKKVHDIVPLASYEVSMPDISSIPKTLGLARNDGKSDTGQKHADGVYDLDYYHGRQKKRQLIYRLRRRTEEVATALEQVNSNGSLKTVVDVGTADGLMLEALQQRFPSTRFIGIDRNFNLLNARAAPSIGKLQGDAQVLPLADGTADALIATAIIEHVPDPDGMMQECARVLRPGGVCILTTPDPTLEHIASTIGLLKDAGHQTTFNLDGLQALLERNGFAIQEVRKFMFSPVGFPAEREIEHLLGKLRLDVVMANQFVVGKRS
jgi:radical SAM superfamily enzyme YgiQ (UPF0313 family)/ubiquinone/menaquinone biosynthesis C-methylase UbiE